MVIEIYCKNDSKQSWGYESKKDRDKAFDEMCAYLTTNYKLRDFT